MRRDHAYLAAGIATVAVAVTVLLLGQGGSTTTALAVGGMAMIGLVYVGPRLLSLRMGGVELVLEQYAAEARRAESAGDIDRASELRQIAVDVLEAYLSLRSHDDVMSRHSGIRYEVAHTSFEDAVQSAMPAGAALRRNPLMADVAERSNLILRPDILIEMSGRRASVDYAPVFSEEFRHRLRRQARAFSRMADPPSMICMVGGPKAVRRRLEAELDSMRLPLFIEVLSWKPGDSTLELKAAIDYVFQPESHL